MNRDEWFKVLRAASIWARNQEASRQEWIEMSGMYSAKGLKLLVAALFSTCLFLILCHMSPAVHFSIPLLNSSLIAVLGAIPSLSTTWTSKVTQALTFEPTHVDYSARRGRWLCSSLYVCEIDGRQARSLPRVDFSHLGSPARCVWVDIKEQATDATVQDRPGGADKRGDWTS